MRERGARAATVGRTASRPRAGGRFAARDVLANPLSVIAATLAAFLCVFALLTSRVVSGQDPALARPTAALGAGQRPSTGAALRTTASGRVIAAAPAATGRPGSSPAPVGTLTTAASGGATLGGDDG